MDFSGSKLYFLQGEHVLPANESLYQNESELQRLIAENPQLLLRDPDDETQQLYLIRQEFPLQDTQNNSSASALDHLFIDQNGVPVLVEVKRSTDTRIKREVMGQMLDYASRIRTWSAAELRALAPVSQNIPERLWCDVENNLKQERMKLVFAADAIPDSLAVLIDFMDRSMQNIDVYGVEIRQYHAADNSVLISSSVVGGMASLEKRVTRPSIIWDAESVAAQLRQYACEENIKIIAELTSFIADSGLTLDYGRGTKFGLLRALQNGRRLFSITSWEKSQEGLRTAIELSLPLLISLSAGQLEEKTLRTLLFRFPTATAADIEQYIFGSTRFQYIDIRLLADPANMAYFKDGIRKIIQFFPPH